jgi:hypothetical protein
MSWQQVADAVVTRRVELGMRTRRQLAEKSGLTVKTLGEIERNERTSYDRSTLAVVERALNWTPGTIHAIATGTELIRPGSPSRPNAGGAALVAELALMLDPSSPLSPDDREIIEVMVGRFLEPYRRKLRELRADQ